ncbi:hypothetical protein B0I35DRAFT_485082 [Stachybotrys elegans]|uniref:Proteasome activator subunit 4 n=1 Tax=Stachybotrys elegans TaxID=80388 RepID=A0A8K0WIX3_9HYPO|nr:hypothetical protein B0I35DRAFT_485082 [Stachybotrys elegans]
MDDNIGHRQTGAPLALSSSAASHLFPSPTPYEPISRATPPGIPYAKSDEDDKKRYRPRTFAYFQQLPFQVEEESERDAALQEILKQLYIAVKAEDFSPGALHWTRELQSWLNLKFEMTRELRVKLTKLYYSLCLAPGLDSTASERFLRMVVTLTRKNHYLKPGEDLLLDWRPLWNEIKAWVLPSDVAAHQKNRKRPAKQLMKLATHAHVYFDPRDRLAMLEEFLPFFSINYLPNAFIVVCIMNALLPSNPAPEDCPQSQPGDIFPTLFHLWSLVSCYEEFDVFFIDLLSRMSKDHLNCSFIPFFEHGIFTKAQSDLIFTAILRLTRIPVGQADSPYIALDNIPETYDNLKKDKEKYPVPETIALLIVNSLSPICMEHKNSVLASLEGLMDSTGTFFHPSNQGDWTSMLGQLVMFLTGAFVLRRNREQSGELVVPAERKINGALKKRFVRSLLDATFMGLFSKSSRVSHCYYNALQSLAYLEPDLVLPGALQRFYPSLQGLVEVHRTTSSLNGLQMIANVMSKLKGYRCHMTALLALSIPGIDANDLAKTQDTLNFIRSVAYSIPMVPLTTPKSHIHDTTLAMRWAQGEMDRMEREGQNVKFDYATELSDEDEINILRSSTAGFRDFILTLLGKVFTLLENLPDADQLRDDTPENNVMNALPAALSPLFASLSPELFDMALDKIATFVSSHVVHQARDAMAWIVNAICKVNPEKTLKVFVPMLVMNIRNEIDFNNAASDRTSGTDYLPRDRALVWHISMLAVAVVQVGKEVLGYKKELLGIAKYMQEKCRGLPTILVSNYIHHLLLNLTHTYPIDHSLYEPEVIKRGLTVDDWGKTTSPADLTIRWHQPSPPEIDFAVELFAAQTKSATEQLERLMSENPPVSRTGKNKEWSDEVSRLIQQIRLVMSGMATMFDPKCASRSAASEQTAADEDEDTMMEDKDPLADVAEDEKLRPPFRYKAGYSLETDDPAYKRIHSLREELGHLLTSTHAFLCANQEDDVNSFTTLYSAYRTWITDVGIDRSARPLERHLSLYRSDIAAFKIIGLRKVYPRPLLIKRAEAYHMLRMKHNASARQMSDLDKRLLLDLAQSSVSLYANVRRAAQSSLDSSLQALVGGKPMVIASVLQALRSALDANEHDKIKGGMYTLFFTSLLRTLMRDWRFAPEAMRLYIETAGIDKPSIQNTGSSAFDSMTEFGKPVEPTIIVNADIVDLIKPAEDVSAAISSRHQFILQRRGKVEKSKADLGLELTKRATGAHWNIAVRCTIFATNLCLRFDSIAPTEFIDLVAEGTNDAHPKLRGCCLNTFITLFDAISMRAKYGHNYRNYLLEKEVGDRNRLQVVVENGDADFTRKFLDAFKEPDNAEYMVDSDHPGWLVWGKKFTAFRAKPHPFTAYDEAETAVRERIGKILTKEWFKQCFDYLKQEPGDTTYTLRTSNVSLLMHAFDLMYYGKTTATLEDIQDLVKDVYEDGVNEHQHRATSEILGALLGGSSDDPPEIRNKVWAFAAPMMLKIFADNLTPENLQYWLTCLHLVLDSKDPRRSHEILDALRSFRLDMSSNAAFKESAKVQLLEFAIYYEGWHFRNEQPILENFLAHIDHPYEAVREEIGRVLSTIYKTRYHESFENVSKLLEQNKADSSIEVFDRLENWRYERAPGQQTPSSYTSGSKTVLMWLDCMLSSHECIQLVQFFPTPLMEQLLHMMDVKEDPELMRKAYGVYRNLPNIPFRDGEDADFIEALTRIGQTAASWHQRLRALVNMQVVYFRRIFLTKAPQRNLLLNAVSDMLRDVQLEVQSYASTTLAGMIRCSPRRIREPIISQLKQRFEDELKNNPMPKRARKMNATDTPVDNNKQITRRHAAVLGLGALIEAFPYATPPPEWMPEVLATLARRAAGDPGVVGNAAKGILSEFKKTRQDSWSVDQKYFTPEQLEDLEGIWWKSYFA